MEMGNQRGRRIWANQEVPNKCPSDGFFHQGCKDSPCDRCITHWSWYHSETTARLFTQTTTMPAIGWLLWRKNTPNLKRRHWQCDGNVRSSISSCKELTSTYVQTITHWSLCWVQRVCLPSVHIKRLLLYLKQFHYEIKHSWCRQPCRYLEPSAVRPAWEPRYHGDSKGANCIASAAIPAAHTAQVVEEASIQDPTVLLVCKALASGDWSCLL